MGWRDYCQRNKPIPPFVMINHLSVWLPVWPGNTLATAGPSGWWPLSSPSGPHLFPHALFRCLCRPGSAPFGPQLCPWPHDRISPAAHSFHRLLGPCPPALRPAPSSKKNNNNNKEKSTFLYLFKFLPWEFWNILIWFAYCCTFPFMPTCFLHRCDSGIPSLGRNTFLSQHKDMLPDKLPIRWRTKEFFSS